MLNLKVLKGRKRKSDAYKKTLQQSPPDELISHPNNDSVDINNNSNPYMLENLPNNEKNSEGNNSFQGNEMNDEVKFNSESIKKQKKPPKKILPGMNIGAYSDEE